MGLSKSKDEIKVRKYRGRGSFIWDYIYEPIGWRLVKILIKFKTLTGPKISLFIAFLTIIAFYLISVKHILAGMVLLQLVLLLDTTDGTLARLKKQTLEMNLKGTYLEIIWHECIFPFFYFVLGIYSYKLFNNPNYIIMGGLTATFILIINLLFHRHSMTYNIKENGKKERRSKLQHLVRWLTCPSHTFTYGLFLTLLKWIPYMVIFYFIFYSLLAIYKFIQFAILTPKNKKW